MPKDGANSPRVSFADAKICLEHLQVFANRVHLHRGLDRDPVVGVHASLFKFPLDNLPKPNDIVLQSDDRSLLRALENSRARPATSLAGVPPHLCVPLAEEALRPTAFDVIGYWERLEIEYIDDFARLIVTPDRQYLQGARSSYGFVLATNSGVRKGRIVRRPFEGHSASPGAFAYYKLNPLLLITGRSDLIQRTAQFIALLCGAPDNFWNGPVANAAWGRVIHRLQLTASQSRRQRAKVIEFVDGLRARAFGLEFLIYQNLGWEDLSVYFVGAPIGRLAELHLLLRDIPVMLPRFVYQLQRVIDTTIPGNPAAELLGAGPSKDVADAAERELIRLLREPSAVRPGDDLGDQPARDAQSGEDLENLAEQRRRIPEMSVFCDYTDVHADKAGELREFGRMVKVQAGSVARFLDSVRDDPTTKSVKILSGAMDLYWEVSRKSLESSDAGSGMTACKTHTKVPVAHVSCYVPVRKPQHSLEATVRRLLEEQFGHDDWLCVQDMLRRLAVPRNLRHALRNLVLAHLAYKDDPILFNTLIGYLDLWRNLGRMLPDEFKLPDQRPQLVRNLTRLVELVAPALSARYHSSSRMFEVADLNPNHRGGVDFFINAYQGLLDAALDCCRAIDRQPLEGIVQVGYGHVPRVYNLFGTIVELDWERLAVPEGSFAILHELGHLLLRDTAFYSVQQLLDDRDWWRAVTNLDIYKSGLDPHMHWSGFEKVKETFADVFCDLFMLHIIRASAPDGDTLSHRGLLAFYDQWYWTHAELMLDHMSDFEVSYLHRLLARWYMVREQIEHWEVPDPVPSVERLLEDIFAEDRERKSGSRIGTIELDSATIDAEGAAAVPNTILVRMPGSEREWARLLERHVIPYSPTVRRFMHPAESCSAVGGRNDIVSTERWPCRRRCLQKARWRCLAFWSDSYGVLDGYLRSERGSDKRDFSPAQTFLYLSRLLLRRVVPVRELASEATRDRRPAVIYDCYRLASDLFGCAFSSPSYRPYLCFDEAGSPIVASSEAPYAPIVINPRGSMLILDPGWRQAILNRRLDIFMRLADIHLSRMAANLRKGEGAEVNGDERGAAP